MIKRLQTVLCVSTVLAISACATSPMGISNTRKKLMNLELGMPKKEVLKIMGQPYSREVYASNSGESLEFLIYITQYTMSGSIPDSDTTPVCLKGGKVVGWGRNYYEAVIKHEVTIERE